MNISRRRALTGATAISVALLASACATSTVNGVTTYTLDLSSISKYGPLLLASVTNAVASPSLAPVLGASTSETVATALATAKKDLATVSAAITPTLTLTMDETSFGTVLRSFLADLQTVSAPLTAVAPLVPAIAPYVSAFNTLLPLFQIAAGLVSTTVPGVAGVAPMSVADAVAQATKAPR